MTAYLNKTNTVLAQLYFLVMNFYHNITLSQHELRNSERTQKNAAFWITVLFIILGVASIAALIWACNHYGNGASFLGEFKFMGIYIKIKCG
ncbi:hypothetical protein [Halobacillus naozhouensis]|uniref:Uncharacterized protein n=1 Tax=Halobacillus naozhouensis TaxID=554880 RepID=A0ABY8IV76_9BACI|nr:hypothetical protein [Halobacillus naozhouensis]WFT74069.1 hypothetical protein P9989_17100 [Halobacillus naozhouensis]